MAKGLTYGLREAERPSRFTYDKDLLSLTGPYGEAHAQLRKVLPRKGFSNPFDTEEQLDFHLRIRTVHECEQAKRWLAEQRSGQTDYWHERDSYDERRKVTLSKAVCALEELMRCDREQPYWIRPALAAGLVQQAPDNVGFDATWTDSNLPEGAVRVTLTPEALSLVEPQFLMQAALQNLQSVLKTAHDRLAKHAETEGTPWRWVGNLYIDPPLSRKEKVSYTRDGDGYLGLATLGLSAALSSLFRIFSVGDLKRKRYVGEKTPLIGRPHWARVADYVNIALPSTGPVTPESLRQQWHTFSKLREVQLHNWPGRAIREPQLS